MAQSRETGLLSPELRSRVTRLAADRQSGATALGAQALAILLDGRDLAPQQLAQLARALCDAQPSMASVWNAAAAAIHDAAAPGVLEAYARRAARAPAALARVAGAALLGELDARRAPPLRVVTMSYSSAVRDALEYATARIAVTVIILESLPGGEGRRLAADLSVSGLQVEYFADSGAGAALERAHAVLLGADAVSADWWVNKVGSLPLAAAAQSIGVPVVLAASRDKFASPSIAARLGRRDEPPEAVWSGAPAGIRVRSPLYDRIPIDLAARAATDIGLLEGPLIAGLALDEASERAARALIAALERGPE